MNQIKRGLARLGLASSLDIRLERLEKGEEGVTIRGTVNVSHSEELMQTRGNVYGQSYSGTTTMHSLLKAVNVTTQSGEVLVVTNKRAEMPLTQGQEVWAIGQYQSSGRFKADYVIDPRLQTYVDATKAGGTSIAAFIALGFAVIALGWVLMVTAPYMTVGYWISYRVYVGPQYGLGIAMIAAGVLMLTTVLWGIMCVRQGATRLRQATPEQWARIERLFSVKGGV